LAEEAIDAARVVPKAMWLSTISISMFGFILNIVLAYCAYDIDAIMTCPLRQPLGALLVSALGNHALARFLWLCTGLSNFGVLFVITVSSSRVYFAYARDGALPFSKFLSHVNDTMKTPVNSTFTLCMIVALLGSISVGSTTALNGLFSGSALAGAVAYLMPVLMR
jgi:amino acid transporter